MFQGERSLSEREKERTITKEALVRALARARLTPEKERERAFVGETLQFLGLTLRCLLLDGALVGVIVTDGVMVRFEPARDNPIGRRWPGVLGVSVAPPGRDGCRCGGFVTGVMLIGDPRL